LPFVRVAHVRRRDEERRPPVGGPPSVPAASVASGVRDWLA
jgi:hypothetical protein